MNKRQVQWRVAIGCGLGLIIAAAAVPGCSDAPDSTPPGQLGTGSEGIHNPTATGGDKVDFALVTMDMMNVAQPFCSGGAARSTTNDTTTMKPIGALAVTASHCVEDGAASFAVFQNWTVTTEDMPAKTGKVRVQVGGWKTTGSAGATVGKTGDIGIAKICNNLFTDAELRTFPAAALAANDTVTIHGNRSTDGTGKVNANDWTTTMQRGGTVKSINGRVSLLTSYFTDPGDSGSPGIKTSAVHHYVHRGWHPDGTAPQGKVTIGTAVTEAIIGDLWNGGRTESLSTYDGTGDGLDPYRPSGGADGGLQGGANPIGATVLVNCSGVTATAGPGISKVTGTGTAGTIGKVPATPTPLIDTTRSTAVDPADRSDSVSELAPTTTITLTATLKNGCMNPQWTVMGPSTCTEGLNTATCTLKIPLKDGMMMMGYMARVTAMCGMDGGM